MRGRAVLQGVEQKAEFLARLLAPDAEDIEHRLLGFELVNTHTAAAQLGAVKHHIVSPGKRLSGVLAQGIEIAGRSGERVV